MGLWVSQSAKIVEPKVGPIRALWRHAVVANLSGASGGVTASTTLSELLDGDVRSHRAWRKVPRDGA